MYSRMNNNNTPSLPTSPHLSVDNNSPPKQSSSPNFNPTSFYGIQQDQMTSQQFFHGTQGFHIPLFGNSQLPSVNNGQPPSMQALNAYHHQLNAYNMYQQHHQRSASYPAQIPQVATTTSATTTFAPATINPKLLSPTLDSNPNVWTQQQQFFNSPNLDASHQMLDDNALRSTTKLPNSGTKRYSNGSAASLRASKSGQTPPATSKAAAPTSLTSGSKGASLSGDNSVDTSLHPGSSGSLISVRKSQSATQSDSSWTNLLPPTDVDVKPTRQQAMRNSKKRPRTSHEEEENSEDDEDEIDDDDDVPGRPKTVKLLKACANCRKQKGRCSGRGSDGKCLLCRKRNLTCVFEAKAERKQPVQRSVLIEQIRRKDAIIESFRQMLQPHMVQWSGSSERLSSGSPPSSAAHEEPLRKQVLEWLEKAEASKAASAEPLQLDSRVYNDSSSSEAEEDAELPEPSNASSLSVSHPAMTNTSLSSSNNQHELGLRSRSRSPRVTKTSSSAMPMHPLGLLARASLKGSGRTSLPSSSGEAYTSPMSSAAIGVARDDYFVSGDSMAQKASQLGLRRIEIDRGLSEEPKLLRKGLIMPEEVDKLFQIYYEKLNVTVNLLDPVLHTPETTFARCPLLFTVVCAVASRYYTERRELYSIAMHFAMGSAASSLMDSKKSVELCQAYLLLSIWPLPSRKYDEDRTWLYLGLAIRMAMDLNLHLPTKVEWLSEQQEREVLNRTRTWIICFNMDRTSAAQLGKPMTIRENYMIRSSADWYKGSKYNNSYDLHLCQTTALMRIMSRFQKTVYSDLDSESGFKEDLNLRQVAFQFDDEIVSWEKEAVALCASQSNPDDPGCRYRSELLPFFANYSRLVILSFGFQYSFRKGLLVPNDTLVTRCLEAAQNVILKMTEDNAARPYLRYAPDGHLVYASFAAAFLLKLLRHKFVHLLSEEKRHPIIPLVERLIRVLSKPTIAIDESHTPMIYARFLTSLLHKHRVHAATAPRAELDQDTDMNLQEHQDMGLTIDLNMVHQHNNVIAGPLSPPSPHPSIQVTPPPVGDHSFGYVLHDSNTAQEEFSQLILDLNTGDSAAPSGSNTIHPMDRGDEEDDDLLLPLRAINDPGFWLHGMLPWPEMGMPSRDWDKDTIQHQSYNMSGLEC
ncbi:hypothetical protein CPB86DRAFT_751962 [Serendipita vermifera]|nr:hypothetical protein CPB86DRAFT_751962 [Serendipita vermifera]